MQEYPGKGAANFLCKVMRWFAAKTLQTAIYFRGGGNAEALYHLFQCADVYRLGQMFVHAGFLALLHILKKGVGRHGEDGDDPAQRVFAIADAAGGFKPSITGICTSIKIIS